MAVTQIETSLLAATLNRFHGVDVDPDGLGSDPEAFADRLTRSLATWRDDGAKVVWLDISIDRAELIPAAAKAGFTFHHSDPDRVVMTLPLVPGAVIPPHATHYIGAGGLVLNDRQELLVITERLHRPPRHYKLPGGALMPGEHLVDAVIREVWEETGIRTRFRALMGFRHWHGYRFGKSDIYCICRLDPLTEEITIQEDEIATCQWLPVEQYISGEGTHPFNRQMAAAALRGEGLVPTWFEDYDRSRKTHEIFVPGGTGTAR